jgi:1,4-dihydroxy-2-naphthoate octaprenyltransferase
LVFFLLIGQAAAYADHGCFSWLMCTWIHLFGALDHLLIVFTNDAADAEIDGKNHTPTPWSGGSRVVPGGLLEPGDLRQAAVAVLTWLLLWSLWIGGKHGLWLAPPLTLLAIAIAWAYNCAPLRLSMRGGGEWLQAIGCGGVLPVIGYYLQAGTLHGFDLVRLIPLFWLAFAGNVLTSLPDYDADLAVKKRSYAVRRGFLAARRDALQITGCAAISTPLLLPGGGPGAWIACEVLPLALIFVASRQHECRRFCVWLGAAGIALQMGWAAAVFLSLR